MPRRERRDRTASALRCALASERTQNRALEAVLDAHKVSDERLRTAIEEIALPALRRCEANGDEVAEQRRRLEAAVRDRVDEDRISADVWLADGWR